MKETFTFAALPQNAAELAALPEASMDNPFKTAALTVLAFCRFEGSVEDCHEMLDFIRGPRGPLSPYDKQFIRDRLRGKEYVARSYLGGTSPANDYQPSQPYTVTVFDDPYSYSNEGYAKLDIRSSGADTPRQVTLRKTKEGKWVLWDQFLLPDIRQPESSNPWA